MVIPQLFSFLRDLRNRGMAILGSLGSRKIIAFSRSLRSFGEDLEEPRSDKSFSGGIGE